MVIAFVYEGSVSGCCVRVAPKGNCVHGASVAVTIGVSIQWGAADVYVSAVAIGVVHGTKGKHVRAQRHQFIDSVA